MERFFVCKCANETDACFRRSTTIDRRPVFITCNGCPFPVHCMSMRRTFSRSSSMLFTSPSLVRNMFQALQSPWMVVIQLRRLTNKSSSEALNKKTIGIKIRHQRSTHTVSPASQRDFGSPGLSPSAPVASLGARPKLYSRLRPLKISTLRKKITGEIMRSDIDTKPLDVYGKTQVRIKQSHVPLGRVRRRIASTRKKNTASKKWGCESQEVERKNYVGKIGQEIKKCSLLSSQQKQLLTPPAPARRGLN